MKALKNISIKWIGSDKKIFIDTIKKNIEENEKCIEIDMMPQMKILAYLEERQDKLAVSQITFQEEKVLFFPLQLRENTEYMCEITLPGTKEEAEKQRIASGKSTWPFINLKLDTIYTRNDKRYWNTGKDINKKPVTMVTGKLNFKSHVGLADLSLGDVENLFIEIVTYKLDYYEDFKNLLNGIADQAVNLILQIGQATGAKFETDYNNESEDYIKIIHLRQMFMEDNLQSSLESIMKNPHAKLTTQHLNVELANLRNPDIYMTSSKAGFLEYNFGGPLAKQFSGYTPTELFETYKCETYDTLENRYIKNFLEDILSDCQRITRSIEKNYMNKENNSIYWKATMNELNQWINKLYGWLTEAFWKNVGMMQYMPSNSQVLQKKEGYRDVLRADLKYQLAIGLKWNSQLIYDQYYGEIKPIYELYEIWCYFRLREVLVSIFGIEKTTDIWKIASGNLIINLKKGVTSKTSFKGDYGNHKLIVDLYYNRLFRGKENLNFGSYSIDFKPDYSLYIQIPSMNIRVFVHFDAKYSFEFNNFSNGDNDLHAAKRIHLEKMHAYKDAIRNSLGAYILYPGNEKKSYSESKDDISGVGAYPLRPFNEMQDENNIEDFIKEIFNKLITSDDVIDEEPGLNKVSKKLDDDAQYKVVYESNVEVSDFEKLPLVSEEESKYDEFN